MEEHGGAHFSGSLDGGPSGLWWRRGCGRPAPQPQGLCHCRGSSSTAAVPSYSLDVFLVFLCSSCGFKNFGNHSPNYYFSDEGMEEFCFVSFLPTFLLSSFQQANIFFLKLCRIFQAGADGHLPH